MGAALATLPQNVPFLPPLCVVPAKLSECSFFGWGNVDCIQAIDFSGIFISGVIGGHFWTAFCMFAIGMTGLYYVRRPLGLDNSMAINASLYSIITALFALLRASTQLGVPLLAGAALHNLHEWIFIIHMNIDTDTPEKLRKYSMLALYWIIFVVGMIIMLPTIPLSAIFEQIFGILVDHALVLYWAGAYLSKAGEYRRFFMFPLAAHSIHLIFTILPLVLANFTVGSTSWLFPFINEMVIYVSAPITHSLYLIWSFRVDELRQRNNYVVPEPYRVHYLRPILIVAFLLGLVSLFAAPILLPSCLGGCSTGIGLFGTSVAKVYPGFGKAFENLIANYNLVNIARSATGNLNYELVKNAQNENEYMFIEHWASMEKLREWLAGYPQVVFSDMRMKGLLVGGSLQSLSGYNSLDLTANCSDTEFGALAFPVETSCAVLWKTIGNWSNCEWVAGCEAATLEQGQSDIRILHMEDGSKLVVRKVFIKDNTMELKYSMDAYNYTGHVKLIAPIGNSTGCTSTYVFSVPRKGGLLTARGVYENFYTVRIPFLQSLYGLNKDIGGTKPCAQNSPSDECLAQKS